MISEDILIQHHIKSELELNKIINIFLKDTCHYGGNKS